MYSHSNQWRMKGGTMLSDRYGEMVLPREILTHDTLVLWYDEVASVPYYVTNGRGDKIELFGGIDEVCDYLIAHGWKGD